MPKRRTPSRIRRAFERRLLGTLLGASAWVIERRLLAVRGKTDVGEAPADVTVLGGGV
ncbi:MAG TPA: hypothetical protein VHF24_07645 [Acidimicrobiales bacterium]|nr:hypothetical protein [Acidimicrobiales bacterium]